jgi:antitoxin ParD1/3/4
MAIMNISLPEQMRNWVLERTEDGEYANNSDYMRHLIRKDKQRAERLEVLQAAITKGVGKW